MASISLELRFLLIAFLFLQVTPAVAFGAGNIGMGDALSIARLVKRILSIDI